MAERDDTASIAELEDGLRFLHALVMQTRVMLADTTSRMLALTETLVENRSVGLGDYETRRKRVHGELADTLEQELNVSVDATPDKYAVGPGPEIDCPGRIPLCKGRCCKLSFPLSFQDLDEGKLRWEYIRPYQIKKRKDGFCVHHDTETRLCTVRDIRPAVCRTYSCKDDKRIWIDFDKRIPVPDHVPWGTEPDEETVRAALAAHGG